MDSFKSHTKKPQILDLARNALLWVQEAKGMSSAAFPPHLFNLSLCPFRMRFARH